MSEAADELERMAEEFDRWSSSLSHAVDTHQPTAASAAKADMAQAMLGVSSRRLRARAHELRQRAGV
jgi:hypothetical protein